MIFCSLKLRVSIITGEISKRKPKLMAPLSTYNDVYLASFCVNKEFCHLFFYCLGIRYGGTHVSVLKLRYSVRTSEAVRGSTSDMKTNIFCSCHFVSL